MKRNVNLRLCGWDIAWEGTYKWEGDLQVRGDLRMGGDLRLRGHLQVRGDLRVGGDLQVGRHLKTGGNLQTEGDLQVDLQAGGYSQVGEDLHMWKRGFTYVGTLRTAMIYNCGGLTTL